ncbi:retrotransposon-related protein [Tanacetum coccineum]
MSTPTQLKWLPKLLGFDYEIMYKKGCENAAADALSRLPNTGELMQITMTTLSADVYHRIAKEWITDDRLKTPIHKLQHDKNLVKNYEWSAQQLLRKGKLRKMKKEVKEWIRNCITCQRFMSELVPPPGLLQPLPIPEKVWTHISMNFVDGLPMSKALTMAQSFLDNVYKLHSLLKVIMSDRDTIFLSRFWCMTGDKPKEWVQWVPLAEYWYNTSFHTSINTTPCQVLYGQPPPAHVAYTAGDSAIIHIY